MKKTIRTVALLIMAVLLICACENEVTPPEGDVTPEKHVPSYMEPDPLSAEGISEFLGELWSNQILPDGRNLSKASPDIIPELMEYAAETLSVYEPEVLEITIDENGFALTITEPEGVETSFRQNPDGEIVEWIDNHYHVTGKNDIYNGRKAFVLTDMETGNIEAYTYLDLEGIAAGEIYADTVDRVDKYEWTTLYYIPEGCTENIPESRLETRTSDFHYVETCYNATEDGHILKKWYSNDTHGEYDVTTHLRVSENGWRYEETIADGIRSVRMYADSNGRMPEFDLDDSTFTLINPHIRIDELEHQSDKDGNPLLISIWYEEIPEDRFAEIAKLLEADGFVGNNMGAYVNNERKTVVTSDYMEIEY